VCVCVCASAWLFDLSACLCVCRGLLVKMLCAAALSSCTHAAVQSLACMSAHSVLFASKHFLLQALELRHVQDPNVFQIFPRKVRRLFESTTLHNCWGWLDHCDPTDILPVASSADLIRPRWASRKCRDNWHCHKFASNLQGLSLTSTWKRIVEAWRPS
jgi:hypothetical protein